MFGSLRYLWEGLDKKFIKYIKHEISILRRSTSHLKLLLEKLFCTSVFKQFNMDNPLQYVEKYEKRMDFKVYRRVVDRIATPSEVLEMENVITGFIDNQGNFYMCFTEGPNKPIRLYPIFLTTVKTSRNIYARDENSYLSIVACIRMDDGQMSLPMPHEEFLKIYRDDDGLESSSNCSEDHNDSEDDNDSIET
eukprot:scaffold48915_cov24-Cyclotella_meneghiniana.AAC.2